MQTCQFAFVAITQVLDINNSNTNTTEVNPLAYYSVERSGKCKELTSNINLSNIPIFDDSKMYLYFKS